MASRYRPFTLLSLVLCALVALPLASAQTLHDAGAPIAPWPETAPGVIGCQHVITPRGLELGIWYPSVGTQRQQALGPYGQACVTEGPVSEENHALIVISHGTGGSWTGHLDSAAALARAGYVVVALTEPGDNWRDTSQATDLAGRTRAMSAALDYMLSSWPSSGRLDRHRIGAFGFSAGGLTTLLAAGARPDLGRVEPWCSTHAASFTCTLIGREHGGSIGPLPELQDHRIGAIAVAAPALGFTMTRASLTRVTMPVQLWQAEDDRILPSPGSTEPVRDNLPSPPEFHAASNAGHFDFLAPCRPGFEKLPICQSASGFDRTAFHAVFNHALVAFFNRTLEAPTPGSFAAPK